MIGVPDWDTHLADVLFRRTLVNLPYRQHLPRGHDSMSFLPSFSEPHMAFPHQVQVFPSEGPAASGSWWGRWDVVDGFS